VHEEHNAEQSSYEFTGGIELKIWLRLHGFEPCSWTSVWEYLRVAFEDIGVEVYAYAPPDDPADCIELWWGDPQFWRWSDKPVKARVALALSEAHSILTKGRANVIYNLGKSDLIICPAEAATTAFREAPFDVPIRVSPFGIEPQEFSFVEREWDGKLRFLHAGVMQLRKGSWLVPEAFVAAFSPDDDVELLMAASRSSPMYDALKGEYGKQPNIIFQSSRVETTLSLYKHNHVYISPHLSEGFGLMPLEAMATGMPCLLARCSAPIEYFHPDYGWWIEMSELRAPVADCLPDTNGFWRVPDVESLVTVMRRAYNRRQECAEKGSSASAFAHTCMTWNLTALSIVEHIKELLHEEDFSRDDRQKRGRLVAGPSGKYLATC